MCFQLHSSRSVRLRGTSAPVATLASSALPRGGSSWREHTGEARLGSTRGRHAGGKTDDQTYPADLYVGIETQVDTIPMFGLPELKEAGL